MLVLAACGPHAHLPPLPSAVPGALPADDSVAILARALAPVLYKQRDESFPLERVVAVVHPTERVIAYHLLWKDDAVGAWIPFTNATDAELVWVGYDSTGAPTTLWTYWHGDVLRADWRGRQTAIDTQWGKHGSLPYDVNTRTLPGARALPLFYAMTWIGLPDLLLGAISRPGPLCFCHGYRRYRDFDHPILLSQRIVAVVRAVDPHPALDAVFGRDYAHKPAWPWLVGGKHHQPPAELRVP